MMSRARAVSWLATMATVLVTAPLLLASAADNMVKLAGILPG